MPGMLMEPRRAFFKKTNKASGAAPWSSPSWRTETAGVNRDIRVASSCAYNSCYSNCDGTCDSTCAGGCKRNNYNY